MKKLPVVIQVTPEAEPMEEQLEQIRRLRQQQLLSCERMTRQDIIRHFIRMIGPKVEMLEIGVNYGDTWHHQRGLLMNYTGVDVDLSRVSVSRDDPRSHWVELFSCAWWDYLDNQGLPEYLCGRKWTLIYIDGCHETVPARLDLRKSIEHLAVGGYLLMHDVGVEENAPAVAWAEVCVPDERLECHMIEPVVHALGMGVAKKVKE